MSGENVSGEHVLVTGGSGFLGMHCIARLLDDDYRVSTTVRTPAAPSRSGRHSRAISVSSPRT